jgi:hypothetical protein
MRDSIFCAALLGTTRALLQSSHALLSRQLALITSAQRGYCL